MSLFVVQILLSSRVQYLVSVQFFMVKTGPMVTFIKKASLVSTGTVFLIGENDFYLIFCEESSLAVSLSCSLCFFSSSSYASSSFICGTFPLGLIKSSYFNGRYRIFSREFKHNGVREGPWIAGLFF